MKNLIFLIVVLTIIPMFVFADDITHQIGNSGYAIRRAMQMGAEQKSPEHYKKAVQLQEEAKGFFYLRKKSSALERSLEAEKEANLAFQEAVVTP